MSAKRLLTGATGDAFGSVGLRVTDPKFNPPVGGGGAGGAPTGSTGGGGGATGGGTPRSEDGIVFESEREGID